MSRTTNDKGASTPVGARVKFRDDHPEYPGMVGTVTEVLTLPGGEPTVGVVLDGVPATAGDIEPWIDVDRCPDCDQQGRYDGRLLLGGRGIYTCPDGHRWQDANEQPTNKGVPLAKGES